MLDNNNYFGGKDPEIQSVNTSDTQDNLYKQNLADENERVEQHMNSEPQHVADPYEAYLDAATIQPEQTTPQASAAASYEPIPQETQASYSYTPSSYNYAQAGTPATSPYANAYYASGSDPYSASSQQNYPASHSYDSYYGQQSAGYPNYTTPTQKPPKKKKEKSRFNIAQVAVVALICTIVGSSASAIGVSQLNKQTGNGNSTSQTATATSNSNSSQSNETAQKVTIESTSDSLIATISDKVLPSVVGVGVTASYGGFFYEDQQSSSEGSGVIYTADGYIVTNYHVIESALGQDGNIMQGASIKVYLNEDNTNGVDAKVVGFDSQMDLAVLKIEKTGLQAVEIGSSADLMIGETAVAIGCPGGLQFIGSVSAGIISGLDRSLQMENSDSETKLIQTDAAINPGNSGGALVDSEGKLIGIPSAKLAETGYDNMGFAIPADDVVNVCDRIISNKDTPQPYIGITQNANYTSEMLQRMGYPAGIVVASVAPSSPAEAAGVQRNDIITHFNGVAVASYSELNNVKNKCKVGDTVKLTLYRGGQTADVSLTLGESNT